MTDSIVSVQHLKKSYGKILAANDISFEVKKGEVFGLLGPNGAGKTTTLECLEGLRKPDSGRLVVDGIDVKAGSRELRNALGVQLQSSSMPDAINSKEAMSLVCAWHGVPYRFDLLKRFGMDDIMTKQYHEMSTGQKRRLHLALALASDPKIVVLDEPTAGLDVQGRAQLHDAIREYKDSGVSILLATHDMAEAEALCDRITIVIRGKMAVTGTPAQITAAGNSETRITIRTKKSSLLPGKDVGNARFSKQSDDYGIWLSRNTASAVMELLKIVQQADDTVEDLRVERPSLEERFLELVEGGMQ